MIVKQGFSLFDGCSKGSSYYILRDRNGLSKHLKTLGMRYFTYPWLSSTQSYK